MTRPVCEATRKDTQPCLAAALPGRGWCWSHDPDRQEIAAAARRDGAIKSNKLRSLRGKRRRLDTHGGLAHFVTNLVYDVAEGRQDPDVARAALYGCSILRQLAEHSVEKRLAEVERLLAQRRPA